MLELNKVYNEDCIGENGMCLIDDKSIDLILCDLPYGTTKCKWDTIIPFEPLWEQYKRVIKDRGAVVLFGSQPFTGLLVNSNLKMFRHEWIWDKRNANNFLRCHNEPMKTHENIVVFATGDTMYNPQKFKGKPYTAKGNPKLVPGRTSGTPPVSKITNNEGDRFPISIINFSLDRPKLHPTQKPVALFEYFIKTYTNENEIILDNCMGSGTTAVACINTNRQYIGFELDKNYYNLAQERINRI